MVEIFESAVSAPIDQCEQFGGDKQQRVLIIKNLDQMLELKACERMFSEIYSTAMRFADLLRQLNCDDTFIDRLDQLGYAPVCSALLERLRVNLTLTDEGTRLFELAMFVYGFHGPATTSNTTVSVRMHVTLPEAKQLMLRLKARLRAPQVKTMLENALQEELAIFKRSGLYQAMCLQEGFSQPDNTTISFAPGPSDFEKATSNLLAEAERHRTVNICGPSGSGKTSLAAALAVRLARAGEAVLLVNHSRMLAAQLRQRYLDDSCESHLTIATFHAHCHKAAISAGLKPPKFRSPKVFNEILPELLVEANHIDPSLRFDTVIVDEGHGFTSSMWRSLKHCLKDSINGKFLFFYDEQVMTFNKLSVVPFATRAVTLPEVFRANEKLLDSSTTCQLFEVADEAEQTDTVQFLVDELLANEAVEPAQIAVLTANNEQKAGRYKFAGGVKSCQSISKINRQAVIQTTLYNFRGLTARIVIVVVGDEIDKLSQWKLDSLSYLALGRATEKIIFVGKEPAVRKLLPKNIATIATTEIANQPVFMP